MWRSKNTQTVGRLWLDLLRFYSVTFDINQHVISLRQASLLSRQEKKWASKKLAIEGDKRTIWVKSLEIIL